MQLKEALPKVNDGECHNNRALLQHVLNVLIITGRWAARYNTWLIIKLTPKGVVFSFLF